MKTMKHPTFDDVFVQVADDQVASWKESGWKQSSQKAANEQEVELKPVDEPAVSA